MKKAAFLLITIFFINTALSQESAIKITNIDSQKEIILKEDRRITIKTISGQKISGRFKIKDLRTILIKDNQIKLTEIIYLKRNPLVVSILTTGVLVYGGVITVGISIIAGAFADSSAFLLTIPAAGMIYTGIKSPNFYRKYKNDGKWKFEIIHTP